MSFKQDVINTMKESLLHIALSRVEDFAETLFQKTDDIELQVDFLKQTTADEVLFEDINGDRWFIMRNTRTQTGIQVSNRSATRHELRGGNLRDLITNKASINGQVSLYDIIKETIKNPEDNDMVRQLKSVCVVESQDGMYVGDSLEEDHFVFLSRMLLLIIHQKLESNQDLINYPFDTIAETVWNGVNLDAIYELSSDLHSNLQQIKNKATELKQRGYTNEATLADTLAQELHNEIMDYIDGKQSRAAFKEHSETLIQNALNSPLSELRGVGKILNDLLNVIIGIITLGIANLITKRFHVITHDSNTAIKIKRLSDTIRFFGDVPEDLLPGSNKDGYEQVARNEF